MEKKPQKAVTSPKSNGATLIAAITRGSVSPIGFSPPSKTQLSSMSQHHSGIPNSGKHRCSNHHSQNNQQPQIMAKKSNKIATQKNIFGAVAGSIASAVGAAPEPTSAVTAKVLLARSKNEEAITDLRQRIPEIDNIFDVHSRIGNGTFSTVLLGTLKKERGAPENTRRKFAIKHHVPTSHPERIMKELQCMARIGGSENVVGINCCIRYNESVAFIMPYMPHDRFHDFFSKMDIAEVQSYMKNLLIALRHVHKFNIIHRDVKPSNFLYNRRKRQYLLVDFGLAQQVPAPQHTGIISDGIIVGKNVYLSTGPVAEGKRMLEQDEEEAETPMDTSATPADVTGTAKRLRCTGPDGDQQIASTTASSTRGGTQSGGLPNAPSFKMPLKQLNEIMAPGRTSNGIVVGCTSTSSGICEPPNSRQVKSTMLNAVIGSRLHQKLRVQTGSNTAGSVAAAIAGTSTTGETIVNAIEPANTKYNTNRNLNATNSPKCFCYGNPQVCNICLIKKEIHASRAGTPGYRPPEVLLKYADQTTAVDIWAVGVIFLSILSSVYPFFKAPNDFIALAEMVTIFGDKIIRKTACLLDRLVTLNQKTKPLDLRKLCVRFRNRVKYSSPELLQKYQRPDGTCEVCKNCDQFFFNCLCTETNYSTEPLDDDDVFPPSAYDLLYKLLEVNPHKRITAEEALKHPFFSETYVQHKKA